jgi:hypothetical protein
VILDGMTAYSRIIASAINCDLLVVMFSVACGTISLVFAGYAHAQPVAVSKIAGTMEAASVKGGGARPGRDAFISH